MDVKEKAGKKMPRIWHRQQEKILKNWGESAACYRYLHYKAYSMMKRQSMRMTLPIIIISTITGTANFAQETFPTSIRPYVPAMIGAANLFGAILTTILQFLKVNELMEAHRVSSVHYGKLARNIRLELTLPISERAHDGGNMVEIARGEYDRLIEQSPSVPGIIIRRFEKQFIDQEDEFTRPEIMGITPIDLYDSEKEKQQVETVIDKFKSIHRSSKISSGGGGVGNNVMNELKFLQGQGIVSRIKASSEDETVVRVEEESEEVVDHETPETTEQEDEPPHL